MLPYQLKDCWKLHYDHVTHVHSQIHAHMRTEKKKKIQTLTNSNVAIISDALTWSWQKTAHLFWAPGVLFPEAWLAESQPQKNLRRENEISIFFFFPKWKRT